MKIAEENICEMVVIFLEYWQDVVAFPVRAKVI